MNIPYITVYNSINSLLKILRDDLKNYEDKDTLLFHIFNKNENGVVMNIDDGVSVFSQLKALLLKDVDKQRFIQVFKGYNMERKGIPTIHILSPSENMIELGIGQNKGYEENDVVGIDEVETYSSTFDSTQSILISSDNQDEVVLIYEMLKTCLTSIVTHFELNGLKNIKISGTPVSFVDNVIPSHIFHQNITLNFKVEVKTNSLIRNRLAKINSLEYSPNIHLS